MIFNENYYPVNAFRICIDMARGVIEGKIYTPLSSEPIPFVGVESVMKMDELFDEVGYPQAFHDKRTFEKSESRINFYSGKPEGLTQPQDIIKKCGIRATFDILVKTRMNASWQGTIYSTEGREISSFDGDIELMEKILEII